MPASSAIVAAFPLLRSLGPLPENSLEVTDWREGTVLVDSNGRPVRKDTLVVGGIMTVYPQHTVDAADRADHRRTGRPSTRRC